MQRIKLFFISVIILLVFSSDLSYAFSFTKESPKQNVAASYFSAMKVMDFIYLSTEDYRMLTGKKMSISEKLSFRMLKMKMKHQLKKTPDFTVADYFKAQGEGGFKILWFLAGLIIPLAALFTGSLPVFIILAISPIVIAYLTKQDRVNKKSVWLGFGASLLVVLLVGIIVASTLSGWN